MNTRNRYKYPFYKIGIYTCYPWLWLFSTTTPYPIVKKQEKILINHTFLKILVYLYHSKTTNMKKALILVLGLVITTTVSTTTATAQHKAKTEITGAVQKEKTVEYTITSSKPFYVGGNVYVLHIGDQFFGHSRQYTNKGSGILTFLIPADEFKTLEDGKGVYLTYGHLYSDAEENMAELSNHEYTTCWSLGKFSKAVLK